MKRLLPLIHKIKILQQNLYVLRNHRVKTIQYYYAYYLKNIYLLNTSVVCQNVKLVKHGIQNQYNY